MSVIGSNVLAGASGSAAAAYQIDRSLRFNSNDTAYLSRTPSSAGNGRTWTLSTWIKTSSNGTILCNGVAGSGDNGIYVQFYSNKFYVGTWTSSWQWQLITDRVFRDPSAWFHLVVSVDTTQATASNRVKIYINGVQETSFSTENYPSQNYDTLVNNTALHAIGRYGNLAGGYFDGYLTEVHFIDGQALAVSDFGEYDDNNVWQPKEYSGSYGTNPNDGTTWSDAVPTADGFRPGRAAADGFDGDLSTYVAINNTTFNLDVGSWNLTGAVEVYTGANMQYAVDGGSTSSMTADDWTNVGDAGSIDTLTFTRTDGNYPFFYAIRVGGYVLIDDSGDNSFHLDFSDNSSNAALGTDSSGNSNTFTVNNLTASSPGDFGAPQNFGVATWTGDGSSSRAITIGFQPDFLWIKRRDTSYHHYLWDVVRGITKEIHTDLNYAEGTATNKLASLDSDGFTLKSHDGVNGNGFTYVAWAWKAGGTASSNTNGTITSSVSANSDYGFSVVTYLGNSTAGATIGHGLSTAPDLIIIKNRDRAVNWAVGHSGNNGFANGNQLSINTSGAVASSEEWFNNTNPTSSVFTVKNNFEVNYASENYVAFCWHEVSGFSKFDSYSGSGSSGNTITTGFKPRFLILKNVSLSENWLIIDSERGDNLLFANLSNAEASSDVVDFTDNGFTLKQTGSASNASGSTYIYAAFAARPAGEEIDSLIDTPTNYSAASGNNGGNYCTLNPLQNSGVTLSNGNLDVTGGGNWYGAAGTFGMSSGKWYFEYDNVVSNEHLIGIMPASTYTPNTASSYAYGSESGGKYSPSVSNGSYGDSWTTGDVIGVAFDADAGNLYFYKNGTIQNSGTAAWTGLTNGPYLPSAVLNGSSKSASLNFGQRPFSQTVPTGYSSLCTANLPTPTIADGSTAFDAKKYDGTGSTNAITSFNMSPDFVWIKNRSRSEKHALSDTVRGIGKVLYSNSTSGEDSGSTYSDRFVSFDSNGFTVGSTHETTNRSGDSYISWAWDAGTVANPVGDVWEDSATKYIGVKFSSASGGTVVYGQTSGSTTVEVWTSSDNSSWTQQGSTLTLSDGHTLTTSDQYVVIRNTSNATFTNWYAAATNGADGHYSSVTYPSGASWSGPAYTDHDWRDDGGVVNTDGSIVSAVRANASAGLSCVSYTGNGTDDETFGHGLNAAPEFIIVKRRDSADDWFVYSLPTANNILKLNATDAASGSSHFRTMSSSTFQLSGNADVNASSGTFIAYCISPVSGYSAVGSYEGNASTDGPFVYTGFRPRWIMIKSSTLARAWKMYDAARDPINACDHTLVANASDAESTASGDRVDLLSNGFKIRTSGDEDNGSGETYLYMAFASNPFQANGGLAR